MTKMFSSVRTPNLDEDPQSRIRLKGVFFSSLTMPMISYLILFVFKGYVSPVSVFFFLF